MLAFCMSVAPNRNFPATGSVYRVRWLLAGPWYLLFSVVKKWVRWGCQGCFDQPQPGENLM